MFEDDIRALGAQLDGRRLETFLFEDERRRKFLVGQLEAERGLTDRLAAKLDDRSHGLGIDDEFV